MARIDAIAAGVAGGDRRSIARAITLVENEDPEAPKLLATLTESTGARARVVGITGAPGVGKSSATGLLAAELADRGQRVAIVAVDPSSPVTGGALLGDRIRMTALGADQRTFVRSMAARGHLGGLVPTISGVIDILTAAHFDTVLLETVGVGQSEIGVTAYADTTLLLLAPRMGDSIQAAKAGLLELADLIAITKSDLEGAGLAAGELRSALHTSGSSVPVLQISSVTRAGLGALADALLEETKTRGVSPQRARAAIEDAVLARWRAWLRESAELGELAARVAAGELGVAAAAREIGAPDPN